MPPVLPHPSKSKETNIKTAVRFSNSVEEFLLKPEIKDQLDKLHLEYEKPVGLEPAPCVTVEAIAPETEEHAVATGFTTSASVAEFLGSIDSSQSGLRAEVSERWKLVEKVNALEDAQKDSLGTQGIVPLSVWVMDPARQRLI